MNRILRFLEAAFFAVVGLLVVALGIILSGIDPRKDRPEAAEVADGE